MQHIQSRGIYHGLPAFSAEHSGLTAIVTGANGISGNYMLRVLSENPKRWKRIICLSRRAPFQTTGQTVQNIEHVSVDFLAGAQEIARVLRDHKVSAEYVFYFSYVQPPPKPNEPLWSNSDELLRLNTDMLANFLDGLDQADVHIQHFMLQTGGKYYGGHLGPTTLPHMESDPRVTIDANFYYPQEDLLRQHATRSKFRWTIHMPGPIVGAVPDAAMNIAFALAAYATLSKQMNKPLDFPGDIQAWQTPLSMSAARLNAYQEEWAVLAGQDGELFNTCDDTAFTWERAWPEIAAFFDVPWTGPDEDPSHYNETNSPFNPRGYGPKGTARWRFQIAAWAKQAKVQAAWEELAKAHATTASIADPDRVFAFLDVSICRFSPLIYSMGKSRKAGWHGCVDSIEALKEAFEDFVHLKMIPPVTSKA